MDDYTATELAYKNGYARGYEDGKRDASKEEDKPTIMNITIQKTAEEAIQEIKDKLFVGFPLSEDTMLFALAALMKYAKENE